MHSTTFSALSQFLSHHPTLGIGFAFLVSFLESIAIIGSIIPGSVTLTAVGVLIGTGIIATVPTLSAAILGAFIGDTLSFLVGKKYSNSLQEKWPFTAYPKLISEGQAFFNQYGNFSIFIGRFVGPIRCILPVSAGILNMNTTRFIIADFISAIVWAPAYLMPGILIGATSLELEPNTGPRLLIAVFVILICAWLLKIGINWFVYFYQRQLLKLSLLIADYFPSAYQHFYRDHVIRCRTMYLLIATLALIILVFIIKTPSVQSFNFSTWYFIQSFRFLNLSACFTAYTLLADKHVIILTGIILGSFWISQKQIRLSIGWLLTAGCTILFALLAKHFIAVPRPEGLVYTRETFSFPSGHSAFITMTLSYFYLTMSHHLKRSHVVLFFKLIALSIFLLIISRLYLGAHWITDVLGGFLIGFIPASLFSAFYIPQSQHPKLFKQSLLVLLSSWLVITAGYGYFKYKQQYLRYQIRPLSISAIKYDAWWQQSKPILPTTRLNYLAEKDVPFNLQWYDSEQNIAHVLKNNGWKSIKPYNWLSFMNRLAHFGNKRHLPLFPKEYHFKPAEKIFIKHVDETSPLLIIRLWKAPIVLLPQQQDKTLYLGSIHYRYIWHSKIKQKKHEFPYPNIESVLEPIFSQYRWRKIFYPIKIIHSLEVDDPRQFYLIAK